MEFTGNHIIDGDNGENPSSPYYEGKEIEIEETCCTICGTPYQLCDLADKICLICDKL